MPTKFFVVLLVAMTLALPVFGQTFGEISGVVYDSTGAVIPGATVTVINPQTNFTRATTSNESGIYSFPSLLPGLYNVRAELSGFQTEVRTSVELQVQQTARIDFRLNVGGLTETVEVSAGAPLLNTENATVGTVIERKRIEDLPINGRSFVSLIALSPNVVTGQVSSSGFASSRSGGERGQVSLSIAGMRRTYTNFTLDGITNVDVDWNTYAFLPSIDLLQEFKVQTGIYSAEFGHNTGQVNVSTKSGTNAYHGTIYEFLRNNALDARPYAFTSKVPVSAPFKWNQYGFTVGGPVQIPRLFNGRDRLFFMSNYEGFKLRKQVQQVYSVPSAAMRTGNFSELLPGTAIRDPLNNRQPFPNNIVPTQRLDRIALGLLEFYPLPNVSGAGLVNNHLALQNNTTDKNQFTQRFDFLESEKSNWFGRYSWQKDTQVAPGLYQNGQVIGSRVHQAAISNTRVFSPTLVNEFRTGYLGFQNLNLGELAYRRNVVKELNIPLASDPPAIAWGTPNIGILGFSGFGDGAQRPFATDDHTFQFIDNISWIRGTHSIKFGGEARRDRYNVQGSPDARGSFSVSNSMTGYGFGDYLLGYISGQTQTAAAVAVMQLRRTSQAYYISDNWKVRPNLTIEMGLRYEYTPAWSSKGDNMSNVIIPKPHFTPNAPASDTPYYGRDCAAYGQNDFYPPWSRIRFDLAIPVKCVSSKGNILVRNDYADFAPRIGVAWSPSPNWTVRAGFGIFYADDIGNMYFDLSRNITGRLIRVFDLTTQLPTLQNPLAISPGPNNCGVSTQYLCVTAPYLYGLDPDRNTPYAEQYELNIQRQLSGSTVLEVGYMGSQGHHLQRTNNYGYSVPGATGSIESRSPYPQFSYGQFAMSTINSNYHSGSLKLTRRLSKGVSALVGYTYSKSLDTGSSHNPENGAFTTKPQQGWCSWNWCGEYGVSDFDSRHRFVASALYELPLGRGKPFLNNGGIAGALLGGWQLNSIVTKSSGFPLVIRAGRNQSNTQLLQDRPDAVSAVPKHGKLENPTTAQWFDIRSVRLQPFGTFGNLGRNTHIGPGIFSWDFSALKNFNFTERNYLQFRFECFNCANHPNFGDPGISLAGNLIDAQGFAIPGTGNFGQITSTRPGYDMRQLQFGLKVIF